MNYKKVSILLKELLKNTGNRKPLIRLFYDLLRWYFIRREGVYYFYIYQLHLRGKNIEDYLTIRQYNKIHDRLDPEYYRPLLEDKIIFDRYIKSFNVPSPDMLGIIDNGTILWLDTNKFEPLDSIAARQVHAYCKLVTSFGGKSIFKIDMEDGRLLMNNKPTSIGELKMAIGTGKYILQRTLIQHPLLNEMNPSCVNTIRVYTISDGGHPLFFGSAFRMGVNNNIVDNVSSNNLATGIKEDHFLLEEAHSGTYPPKWYRQHPNSGIKFSEFKLPFLREAYELCVETHKYFGDFFFIAWDIATTPEGPVILEGNPAADLLGLQVLYGGQKSRFLNYAGKYSEVKSVQ